MDYQYFTEKEYLKLNVLEKELSDLINSDCIYNWTKKQTNQSDDLIKDIYEIKTYENLLEKMSKMNLSEDSIRYLTRKWFKIKISKVDEYLLFCRSENAKLNLSAFDNTYDGIIGGIKVDLKSTVVPNGVKDWFNGDALIRWFYENQSKERRYGLNNRIFIVCKSDLGEKETDILQTKFMYKGVVLKKFCDSIGFNIDWKKLNINGKDITSHIIYIYQDLSGTVQYKIG